MEQDMQMLFYRFNNRTQIAIVVILAYAKNISFFLGITCLCIFTFMVDGSVMRAYKGWAKDAAPTQCKATTVWITISVKVCSCGLFPL